MIVVVATVMLLQIVQSAGLSIRDHIQAARDPIISTSPLSVAQVVYNMLLYPVKRIHKIMFYGDAYIHNT